MKIKTILKAILCSMFCLTTLVGCSGESPYKQIAEAKTLDFNGIPVYIEPDEKTLQMTIDKYFKQLEKQPDYLMKNCTEIHFQCEDIFIKRMLDEGFVQNETEAELISGSTTNTTVYMNTRTKKLGSIDVDENDFKETLTHELWHVYDDTHQIGDSYPSDNVQIVSIYNQNPSLLGEYGATNTLEFFAEAGEMYIYEPDKLKEKSIDLYNYFESLPKE